MPDARALWSVAPPEARSRMTNWPTVLFSWWCTSSAAVIIITRVLGRKVRSDRLFREDWIMLLSIIPLFIRMIFIHFVLIYGTNNINTTQQALTDLQLYHHSVGARLVLPARIFFAMFIWLNKLCVSEFLKRITIKAWRRSWEVTLRGIRVFLFVTFGAVVIATLAECQPFHHYWQVIPDPGPHCRLGYANLFTVGICDIITDILLIAFPIPVVLKSGQSWKRKLQMVSLFSLSVVMIAVTATRMPQVIAHQGRQQYRTVWASGEILASAAVSNGVILGSFLRDKGTRKNKKYKNYSFSDSIERTSTRRPTITAMDANESDEDLFRSVGCRIPPHLQDHTAISPRPAPPAMPAPSSHRSSVHHLDLPPVDTKAAVRQSDEEPVLHHGVLPSPAPSTSQSASFFDVGNLLDEEASASSLRAQWFDHGVPATEVQDFAGTRSSLDQPHVGSSAFLRDIGGLLNDARPPRRSRPGSREAGESPNRRASGEKQLSAWRQQKAPMGVLGPMLERQESPMSLQDAGGLLSPGPAMPTAAGGPSQNTQSRTMVLSKAHSGAVHEDSSTHAEDIELEDIGGLLSGPHRRADRPALSLQEMLRRDRAPPTRAQNHHDDSNPNDVVLHDPGGLIQK